MSELYHDSLFPVTKVCVDCHVEHPLDNFYRGCTRCIPCEKQRRKHRSHERLKQFENLPSDITKVCTVCQIEKPLDDFYKHGAGMLGRSAMCKICTLETAGYMTHLQKIPLAEHGGKVCHKCLQEKPLDAFNKEAQRKDGLALICIECSRAYHSDYAYRAGKRKRLAPLPQPVNGGKVCTKCLIEKPLTDFARKRGRSSRDGYHQRCKECANAQSRKNYAARDNTQKNEQSRLWYEENKQHHRSLVKQWTTANRLQANEIFHRYRARKLAATIDEVDYAHILERDSDWCYICNGTVEAWHEIDFDHVTPLSRGGAHSEENIKVTHRVCNRRKHNKLLSEMTPRQRRGV